MKLCKVHQDYLDHRDWPMVLSADQRQKLLQDKIARASHWLGLKSNSVADLVKECCCEQHQKERQAN